MPRGGQNAAPTRIKALRGTLRKDRTRNEPEPRPATGRIPHGLAPEARAFWRKLAPRLAELGLLTELDVLALSELCLCLARVQQAEAVIARDGLLVPGARGLVKHPAAQLSRDYGARAWQLAARFGLTPADRGRLSVAPPVEVDPLAEYLAGLEVQG